MNILLINPPQTFYPGSNPIYCNKLLPIGLLSVASYIKAQGHTVFLVDALRPDTKQSISEGGFRVGMLEEELEAEIARYNPDIIGISNLFTSQFSNAVFCAKVCKKIFPTIPIVIGGNHPSVAAEEILKKHKDFDIVVAGEGELTFKELIDNYDHGTFKNVDQIDGIVYRDATKGQIRKNKARAWIRDLDSVPYPDYELIDTQYYVTRPTSFRSGVTTRALSMVTSRGCVYTCNFCSVHLHMGNLLRAHSAEYIAGHIEWVIAHLKVGHISFEDDGFNVNLEKTKSLLKEIVKRRLKFTWNTPNGIRADGLDDEFLCLAKKTGVVSLRLGIESGCQATLDNIIKKRLRLDDVLKSVALCKKHKVSCDACFMIGFPGETLEAMKETMQFRVMLASKFGVASGLSIATPLFGTALFEEAMKKNLLVKTDLTDKDFAEAIQGNGKSLLRTSLWAPEDIKRIQEYDTMLMRQLQIKQIFTRPVYSLKRFWITPHKLSKIVHRLEDMLKVLQSES
ncbi:B12-binding domain-containing radical SAM protein [Candidatus Omnitrophota bacterium]